MARVTVEDCIRRVPNRFELVLLATRRARDLAYGAQLTVARQNDRNSVVSLREIAEGSVCTEQLKASVLNHMCAAPLLLSEETTLELTEDELLLQEELAHDEDDEDEELDVDVEAQTPVETEEEEREELDKDLIELEEI